ncbi:MAG: preprotein translocase subunit YajC [Erysipelotrichaceae bacterium]|nr:preprotein translocase subunit YajC [Erysipelotrichaceae bacterium]MCI9524210.1 preprotein translocase subunit YajC [Erysipelotrichaceae bacterium]
MTIEWNIILWCCITISVIMIIFVLIYYIMTARMMKRKRQEIITLTDGIKVGKKVMFAGIVGKIVSVNDEFLKIEVAKGVTLEVNRFAVTNLVD